MNLMQTEEEEKEVSPDVGENLMMRRSMIILEKDEIPIENYVNSWL